MIDALEMEQVTSDARPHPSHRMGSSQSTIVACASNDRFGSVVSCERCGARDVKAGGPGSRYFDEALMSACVPTNEGQEDGKM